MRQRFERFLTNLQLTTDQVDDGETKHRGVTACLNDAYWGVSDETSNRLLIGSWGKFTRVRPPRDVDVLFVLPSSVYWRFEQRTGNKQSQLLQEVRGHLQSRYGQTTMRGDGQVVVVPFNSYQIEVAPAFVREGGGYLICDTNNGGTYKYVDPLAEMAELDRVDRAYAGNVRKLSRAFKQWQRHCNVPIKSFQLERLIAEALAASTYGARDEFWFDWLVRDVFAHMITRAHGWFDMPVTAERIYLGDAWLSRAQSAYDRALKACVYEDQSVDSLAGIEWQKIFGTMIPMTV